MNCTNPPLTFILLYKLKKDTIHYSPFHNSLPLSVYSTLYVQYNGA